MGKFYDNHNHCQFSFDGNGTTVETTARAAIAKGLAGVCFTDHCDFYVPPMKAQHEALVSEVFDVGPRNAEIDRVNALIRSGEIMNTPLHGSCMPSSGFDGSAPVPENFRIFKGIEIGVQKCEREKIAAHLAEHQFDEVIASVHYLDGTDPFWGGYYDGKDWRTAYGHYLETLYEEMVWLGNRFDIMGHYDYVVRYAPYPRCCMAYRDFADIFDEILRFLAENGKALEINTKTYQDYSGRTIVHDKDVLLRFRELGGEHVSLGSDSHDPSRIGCNFSHFAAYIRSCGFRYLVHFENHRPVMTPNG